MFNLKNLFLLCLFTMCSINIQAQCTASQINSDPYSNVSCNPLEIPYLDLTLTPVVSLSGNNICIKINESITDGLLPVLNQSSSFIDFHLYLNIKVINDNTQAVVFSDSETFSYRGNGSSLNEFHWDPQHSAYSTSVSLTECSKSGIDYSVIVEIINTKIETVGVDEYTCSSKPAPVMNLNGGSYTISAGSNPEAAYNVIYGAGTTTLSGFYKDSNNDIYVTNTNQQCSESPCEYEIMSYDGIVYNPIVLHDAVITGGPYVDLILNNSTSPLSFTFSTNGGVIKQYHVKENVSFINFTPAPCDIVSYTVSYSTIFGNSFSVTPSGSANNIAVSFKNNNGCGGVYIYEKNGSTWSFACEAYFGSAKQSSLKDDIHEVSLYPNPVENYLNIEHSLSIKQITILDVSGRIVKREKLNDTYSNYRLNVNDLVNGIYFVRIENELGESHTKKFVK